jgi:hypothetical protein
LLTRRYIDGQRARYVSPLALFLFSVFLMLFVYSLLSSPNSVVTSAQNQQEARREGDDARKLVAQRRAELAKATTPDEREKATDALSDAQVDLIASNVAIAALDTAPTLNGEAVSANSTVSARGGAVLDMLGWDRTHPTLAHIVRRGLANPELTLYKVKNSAYKFAFMLVPISLPFLWLMFFWRKGITIYDHVIFVLYSLSFMSLWFVIIGLLGQFTRELVVLAALVTPAHTFMQLRETYALGWFATSWRTLALMVVATIVFMLFMLLILAISLH